MPPRAPKNNAALAASLVALIGACAALPYFLSRGPSEGRRVGAHRQTVTNHIQPPDCMHAAQFDLFFGCRLIQISL